MGRAAKRSRRFRWYVALAHRVVCAASGGGGGGAALARSFSHPPFCLIFPGTLPLYIARSLLAQTDARIRIQRGAQFSWRAALLKGYPLVQCDAPIAAAAPDAAVRVPRTFLFRNPAGFWRIGNAKHMQTNVGGWFVSVECGAKLPIGLSWRFVARTFDIVVDPGLRVAAAIAIGSDAAGCIVLGGGTSQLHADVVESVRRSGGAVLSGAELTPRFARAVEAVHTSRVQLSQSAAPSQSARCATSLVRLRSRGLVRGGVTLVSAGGSDGSTQLVRLEPRGAVANAITEFARIDAEATAQAAAVHSSEREDAGRRRAFGA